MRVQFVWPNFDCPIGKSIGLSYLSSALKQAATTLGATAIQLTAQDLRDIDRAASEITVKGERYPEHLQRMVGR